MSRSRSRPVNNTLGKQPNIGPFPAEQLVPWAIIAGISYYFCHRLFKLNWIWTSAIALWLISTWWVLTANGHWPILSKFIMTPNWTRVRVPYQRIYPSSSQSRRHKF